MNTHKLGNNKGFTLIEVMIAIAIIGIGMIAVMSLVITVMKGNTLSKRVTTAATVAHDRMEDLKRMGYDNIADDSDTETVYDIDYYWEATVQADTPAPDTKTITIDVYWAPGTSTSTHNFELKTIITQ